jgi:hypothetical protein
MSPTTALFEQLDISLGTSSDDQRALDTWERLQAAPRDGDPDPNSRPPTCSSAAT